MPNINLKEAKEVLRKTKFDPLLKSEEIRITLETIDFFLSLADKIEVEKFQNLFMLPPISDNTHCYLWIPETLGDAREKAQAIVNYLEKTNE